MEGFIVPPSPPELKRTAEEGTLLYFIETWAGVFEGEGHWEQADTHALLRIRELLRETPLGK